MCGSKGFNDACCPSGQVFQENICGNFNGPLIGTASTVWAVDPIGLSDYFQGTFEVFNASVTPIDVIITRFGLPDTTFTVPPLTTTSRSVLNPTSLVITVDAAEKGKYCIDLYKRVF